MHEEILYMPLWLVYNDNQILLLKQSSLFLYNRKYYYSFLLADMNKAGWSITCSLAIKGILILLNSCIVPCLSPKPWSYQIVDQIIMWQSCTREIFGFCFVFFYPNPISYFSLVTVFCTSSFHVAQVVICSLWFAAVESYALFLIPFSFFLVLYLLDRRVIPMRQTLWPKPM